MNIFGPTLIFGALFKKTFEVKMWNDAFKRTFKTKAVQTKLNLYIKKYMKKETLQIF